jgi:hypothetical protein
MCSPALVPDHPRSSLRRLALRLLLSSLATSALLLTLAPVWARAVAVAPEGAALAAMTGASAHAAPSVGHGEVSIAAATTSPSPSHSHSLSLSLSPSLGVSATFLWQVSVAAATLYVVAQRLPMFGLAWYAAQWLVAAALLGQLGWVAVRALVFCLARAAPPKGAAGRWAEEGGDHERAPLRGSEREVEIE